MLKLDPNLLSERITTIKVQHGRLSQGIQAEKNKPTDSADSQTHSQCAVVVNRLHNAVNCSNIHYGFECKVSENKSSFYQG